MAAAAAGAPAVEAVDVVRVAAPAAAPGAAAVALAAVPAAAPPVRATAVSARGVRRALRRRAPLLCGADLQASGDDSQPCPFPTARGLPGRLQARGGPGHPALAGGLSASAPRPYPQLACGVRWTDGGPGHCVGLALRLGLSAGRIAPTGVSASRQTLRWMLLPPGLVPAVPVTTVQASGYGRYEATVRARWTAPDGTRHTGTIPVPRGATADRTVPVWVDAAGRRTGPPLQLAQVRYQAELAAILAPMMAGLVLLCGGVEGSWFL